MSEREHDALTVPCPHCRAPVTGDTRFCSSCGTSLTIGPSPNELPLERRDPPDERRPQGAQWLVLIGAALSLLIFAVALGLEIRGGNGDARALSGDDLPSSLVEGFTVLDWRPVPGVIGVVIVGEVRNDNAVAAGVRLQVIARDSAGNVVDTLEYWPAGERNIAPGRTEPIDVIATQQPAVTFDIRIVDARVW